MHEELIGSTIDKTNEAYADFPEFLDGHTFLGYDNGFITEVPEKIPVSITMRQARLILIQYGLDTAVENAINAITDDTQRKIAQTEWEYAAEVYRYNGWVEQLAPTLNLTPEQLDALFIEGSKL